MERKYKCTAPDNVFTPKYEDVKPEYKKIIEQQNGLGCEGGGVPGSWCKRLGGQCHWLKESTSYDRLFGVWEMGDEDLY